MPCGVVCFTLWFVSWLFFGNPDSHNQTTPIVDLGYAQYQGHYDPRTDITSFLSVRYATPPLGQWRFHAPQPPVYEPGVQVATQNPNKCYQAGFGVRPDSTAYGYDKQSNAAPVVASEDCLFLNVFVPGTTPTEPVTTGGLPVLVWIHGGGYVGGSAAQYNGAFFVANSLNTVIVVVIQYRLGAFGFLSGNEVKARGALNAGLLDQAFALGWVQNYIGLFGGDKTRVTVWGESAGAGSVVHHIVAHGGNTQPPLFDAAIASSTFLSSQYRYNDRAPQSLYNLIVAKTGCASSADTFGCLQSVNAETLQAANYDLVVSTLYHSFPFLPVVDGAFIHERPAVTLASGQVNGRVLLTIMNEHEGRMFVNTSEVVPIAQYISQQFPDMTAVQVQQAAAIYKDHGSALEQAIMVTEDATFVCPTRYLLEAFAGRSWKGLFAIPPADHADDLRYYFYSPSEPPPYHNIELIRAFSQSFMSVIKYGDVNVKFDPTNVLMPHWDVYADENMEMVFNRTEAGVPVVEPIMTDPEMLRRCAFWASVASAAA